MIQSAVSKGRLGFSESKEDDQLIEIGHDDKVFSNLLLQAYSCKIEALVVDNTHPMPSEETTDTGGAARDQKGWLCTCRFRSVLH